MSLEAAQQILRAEAAAIGALAGRLDAARFARAVELLVACAERGGRVVVSGMGKAGIVGQRLAATLSSTGTPAFSLHPGEALHGDLGMLGAGDLLVLLSKSGETREIIELLPCVRRLGLGVIAVTSSAGSVLGQGSDLVLELGEIPEADPSLPVPSSSAAAMAALGDALALCAMRRRGITPEEYFKRHPGGLGWRHSSAVSQVMRTGTRCALAAPETPVAQVLALISEARCGAACIVDEARRLLGVFTDGDFRRGYAKDMEIGSRPVGECMTRPCLSILQTAKIDEAQGLMHARRVNALPVVDADGRVAGLLDIQDVVG